VKSTTKAPGYESTYSGWGAGNMTITATSVTSAGKKTWRREIHLKGRNYNRVISDKYPASKTGPMEISFHAADHAPIFSILEMRDIARRLNRPIVANVNGVEVMVTKDQTAKEAAAPFLAIYPNALDRLPETTRARFEL
jgi:hypothetical protein